MSSQLKLESTFGDGATKACWRGGAATTTDNDATEAQS
jgi:hypothetical protein